LDTNGKWQRLYDTFNRSQTVMSLANEVLIEEQG